MKEDIPNGFHEVPINRTDTDGSINNNNNNNNNNILTKKSIISNEEKKEKSQISWRAAAPQILASSAKNMLLFTLGTTVGLPTIAIPALSASDTHVQDAYLSLTRSQISWFSSINLICVPLGCFASGRLTQPFGRKRSMMFMNLPYAIAFLMFAYSKDVSTLYLALIICGLNGGLLEAPVLTYVAEITQPHLRGMLSAVASISVILGTVSQLLLGSFMNWRNVALINLIFPVLSTIILFFIPESPHWLITKDRISCAEKSLCWLRGWVTPDKVQLELKQIQKGIQESNLKRIGKDGNTKSSYKMYMRRTFFLPYLIVTFIFFIGQFGGMTTLLTHAVGIFESLEAPLNPYIAALLLGVAEMAGAIICTIFIHYTGKRPLTLVSTSAAAISFFIVAVYAQFYKSYGWDVPFIPTLSVLMAAFTSYLSIRILPWMLVGEVFPNNIRATASGLSASSSYIFGFTINKLYFPMRDLMSLHGLFYFYGFVNIIGCMILYKVMPETEGKTLHDIELHFADKSKTFVTHISESKTKELYAADNYAMEKDDEKC